MKVGFIDYYLDEWHANHYPQLLQQKSGGRLEVAYAYGKIDSPITGKQVNNGARNLAYSIVKLWKRLWKKVMC